MRASEPEDATAWAAGNTGSPTFGFRSFATRHLLAIIVLLLVSGLAVGGALALRGVVHSQERRLLEERANELKAYLHALTTQSSAALAAAGAAVVADGPNTTLFRTLARTFTADGASVGVARQANGTFQTVAADGSAVAVGTPLSGVQLRLIRRAAIATGLVYDIGMVGGVNQLVEAVAVPAPKPTVVFLQNVLPKPRPVETTKDSPYRELDVALYAGRMRDRSRLILIYGAVPKPSSHPVQVLAPFGADKLLIVAASHSPLVGSFAHSVPWLVLAAGLVLAMLLAALIEVLSRRRAYALNLVEQRTRAMYQAQVTAEAANRSKSEFLSRMSHELRTPLNAVLGFSQLLELDELTPDQEQAVRQISKGGRHLLNLINEILDISRIETGKLRLSPEAVSVGELIAETVDLIRPLAAERGVHMLDSDVQACNGYVLADRQRLKQILLNLLGNGIKYNREGGSVSIGCARPTPAALRILVTDTGPGIAQEQFHLLFTPFERLGATRNTVEGTGIGLALSRRLAEAMGGTLDVDSTVGRGSTFWVDLPVVQDPVGRVERLQELPAPAAGSTVAAQPAVLHIEDNLANIELIERVLAQRPGVNLIPAMQGRLGLELARQHRPALILLDLNLADVTGEEVLQLLRDDPATAQIPVAIVSADAMPRQVQRLLATGATAYLTKPIDVRELLDLIDAALEQHRRRSDSITPIAGDQGGG